MATDVFSEWPPAHYLTESEMEEQEMELDRMEMANENCRVCGFDLSMYGCENGRCFRPLCELIDAGAILGGTVENGEITFLLPPDYTAHYAPRQNGQCDCGGYHSPANCPFAIIGWDGWQA